MKLKISRILHAGYIFECAGTQIAFDPIFENPFSSNLHAYPSVRFDVEQIKKLKLNAVFISHYHDDHCSFESLNLLDRQTPIYMYCIFEEMFVWLKELGFADVHSLQLEEPVTIGPVEIIPRRALDADVDSIFQIRAAGVNVLNVVDSWIDDEMLAELVKSGPWDMVLWPFQTMREIEVLAPSRAVPSQSSLPPEWLRQLKLLNPRYVVPSSCQFLQESWSWYNQEFFPLSYRQFQKQIEALLPKAGVVRLNPSVAVELVPGGLKFAGALPWVIPVGEQDVDYDYRPGIRPPSTAVIARQFAALTPAEAERVFVYCDQSLLEKFNSLEAPLEPYFQKARLWRLSVYDHLGQARHFYYRVTKNRMEPAAPDDLALGWATEIPLTKLYAALEFGEALTSLYVRINDLVFAPGIENEIQDVDAVEDPLVRCLYSNVFGAYQRAQLKRLLK